MILTQSLGSGVWKPFGFIYQTQILLFLFNRHVIFNVTLFETFSHIPHKITEENHPH